jgi:CDP-paratose 2-epimerase
MVEYFRRDDRDGVESVLADLRGMGVTDLRTIISWAEWDSPEGSAWYDWLLPRLASEVNLIPCVLYTSLAQGVVPRVSAPPWDPKSYGDFIDILITRFGACFDWVELWNEPDRLTEWDRTLDPHWQTFCAMIGGAAYWAQRRGKRTVLAGLSVFDPTWLELMFRRGVMQYIDAVGIHGFPGVSEVTWEGWPALIHNVQQSLNHHRSGAEIWITSTGYSTWRHDEYEQLRMFVEAIETPVERVYWYCARDLDPEFPTREGFHADDRDYHFGLRRSDGTPKLLPALVGRRIGGRARRARHPDRHAPKLDAPSTTGTDHRRRRICRYQFGAPAVRARRARSRARQFVASGGGAKSALAIGYPWGTSPSRVC